MKLPGLKPTPSAPASPAVQFVPGDDFFMRRFELPAGTEPAEVPGFVELQLEELSPFPLEQLHHGHVRASDGSSVFVYAAYRRRLPAGQAEGWSSALFVLPDFAPVLKQRFPVATVVLAQSAGSMTALYFDADRELPVRAAGRALPVEASADAVASVRRAVLDLVDAGSTQEMVVHVGEIPQQSAQGLAFSLSVDGAPEHRLVVLELADCWTMDVREQEFIAQQRKRLRVDLVFWRVVQGAAAAIILLFIGELLLLAGHGYAAWAKGRIRSRAPEAAVISDKHALAIGLEDFRRQAVQPFDMFRILNRGRSPNVYLTSATLDGHRMEIEGAALSVAEYNAYFANLKSAPELAAPPVENEVKTNNNLTTFKLVVTFKPDVFAVAEASTTP